MQGGVEIDFQIKGKGKNKKQHAGYICKFCEFGHTTVPYGIGAQGHAVGTNQRGKGPPIATVMNTPHAQGRKSKNQTADEPQGRNRQRGEKKGEWGNIRDMLTPSWLRQSPYSQCPSANKC